MGLIKRKKALDNELLQLIVKAEERGMVKGYDDGFEDGYKVRKKEDKAAISDGLRKGSSKCGKVMRKM